MTAAPRLDDLPTPPLRESKPPLIMEARGLVKRYGHVTAINGADFELRPGEILAVIGDNGAGKSSLIKALSGALIPDEGQIFLDGKEVHFKSPSDARQEGIETVYQDLAVAPAMSIAENLFLGREIYKTGPLAQLFKIIDKKKMLEEATRHMQDLQFAIKSMSQPVETLSGGQRQGVAVARSAAFAKHVVIMDEPTAALGVAETAKVEELITRLRERDLAILLVSHNMDQVMRLADRITVLRRGTQIGTRVTKDTDKNEIVSMITGLQAADDQDTSYA